VPQRLRAGQGVVLRPGAIGRRLRHGPGRPP
ncbi:MAG: NADH-dependent dehydrogenase, partial [uncultured Sphingomonadaceae bacterium]